MNEATVITFFMPDGTATAIDLVDHVPGIGTGFMIDNVLYRVVDVVFKCAEENPPTDFGWNVYLKKDDQQQPLQ